MIGGQKFHNSRYSLKLIIVLWYYQQRERTKFSFSIINRTFYYAPHNAAASPFLQFSYQNRSSMRVTVLSLFTKIYKYLSFFTHTLFFFGFQTRGKNKRTVKKGYSFFISGLSWQTSHYIRTTMGYTPGRMKLEYSVKYLKYFIRQLFQILVFFPLLYFTLYHRCSLLDRFHLCSFICHM